MAQLLEKNVHFFGQKRNLDIVVYSIHHTIIYKQTQSNRNAEFAR